MNSYILMLQSKAQFCGVAAFTYGGRSVPVVQETRWHPEYFQKQLPVSPHTELILSSVPEFLA
jgi:hypothetical protein